MSPAPNLQKAGDAGAPDRTGLREVLSWLVLLLGFVYGPLDPNLRVRDAMAAALRRRLPPHANWSFCFGGLTFFLFGVQVISGTLLLFHYRPTVAEAFASVQFLSNHVAFGWLIRSIHRWASSLMMVTMLLHIIRVVLNGAYRPPRELNWVVGVILLVITPAFGFTGQLLPWDQASYWTTSTGLEILGRTPLVGPLLQGFLRGGPTVSGATLTRFFVLHVVILPFTITFFLFAHFAMVRRLGVAEAL
ncbi:MAG: cytochrome b N-terminal domain-containing protein [candidate division NC10 bacterium]|nr:cytochrome b N-terminal domain-containing protein [candidate division NC10 bacterium]MBI4840965.1 cytochrome b N-terminal domain-containing protein [candidate division NC10 bacterium]